MNEQSFNKELTKIAPDLRLLFHPERKRWGIFQIRSSHILTLDADREVKPWLLFMIEGPNGAFRLPDMRDLGRVANSVNWGHKLWDKGGDWYEQQLVAKEKAKTEAHNKKQEDLFNAAARDARPVIAGTRTRH